MSQKASWVCLAFNSSADLYKRPLSSFFYAMEGPQERQCWAVLRASIGLNVSLQWSSLPCHCCPLSPITFEQNGSGNEERKGRACTFPSNLLHEERMISQDPLPVFLKHGQVIKSCVVTLNSKHTHITWLGNWKYSFQYIMQHTNCPSSMTLLPCLSGLNKVSGRPSPSGKGCDHFLLSLSSSPSLLTPFLPLLGYNKERKERKAGREISC